MSISLFTDLNVLKFHFPPSRKDILARIKKSPRVILEKKYHELGPVSFHELMVCVLFVILVLLWMFRDPQFMPGWISWLGLRM